MTAFRKAIGIAVLFLLCCACAPRSAGDLDLRTDCASVTAERTTVESGVAMTVRADGCRDAATATDRVAEAAWRSLRQPVDEIRIVVTEPGHERPATTSLSRSVLTQRFGAGPSGPVVAPSAPNRQAGLWLLLPIAWLAMGLGVLLLMYRAIRTGAVLLILR